MKTLINIFNISLIFLTSLWGISEKVIHFPNACYLHSGKNIGSNQYVRVQGIIQKKCTSKLFQNLFSSDFNEKGTLFASQISSYSSNNGNSPPTKGITNNSSLKALLTKKVRIRREEK